MKLLSLNLWGGHVYESRMDFLKEHAATVDIFCFQEVFSTSADYGQSAQARSNIYQEIEKVLPDFRGYFNGEQDSVRNHDWVDFPVSYGLATFIRSSVPVKNFGDFVMYGYEQGTDQQGDMPTGPGNLQYFELDVNGTSVTVANVQGLWSDLEETDSPNHIQQSERVAQYLQGQPGEKILCGDFNLMPTTKSLAILEQGMRNLVKEKETAPDGQLYEREDKQANYTLVSPGVTVHGFSVMPDVVSDHLAMSLEFSVGQA